MLERPIIIRIIILQLIVLFLSIFAVNCNFIYDTDSDLLLRIRGPRSASSKICFIYLDESDIEALGGWPITRDYYSYAIHILTEKNAKVIGLDFLLNTPNRQYPEYDRMLAGFIKTSHRVVLPCVLNTTEPDIISIVAPIPELIRNTRATGFSNLSDGSIQRRIPIVYEYDSLSISFGLALAKNYLDATVRKKNRYVIFQSEISGILHIPTDNTGSIRINPAGCASRFQNMRFTRLLKTYESNPDSLNFTNQLVLIGATAPSLPVIRSTALCQQIPAALIHATVAENIIGRNWLRTPPITFSFLWLTCWVIIGFVIGIRTRWYVHWLLAATAILIITSLGCLYLFQMIFPLCLSFTLMWGAGLLFKNIKTERIKETDSVRFREIEERIRTKENELEQAEQRLQEMESRLVREAAEKTRLSEKTRQLTKDQETRVLDLEKQIRDLKGSVNKTSTTARSPFPEIIHAPGSPLTKVLDLVSKVAPDNIPVLIQGETGTGKELIARAIHQTSHRKRNPFVPVNCGALSESLLESELFGHEKGAFTGAQNQRRGRFELARGGTIFLDEITETSTTFQARLLRVLQEGTFERVGGEQTLHADVRVIAAHNKDLSKEVLEGHFREDLFFRLNAFPLDLPPLRNRKQDIPPLIEFFLKQYQKLGNVRISEAVMTRLQQYRWPGNVRELENLIRRAVLLAESEGRNMVQLKDIPEEVRRAAPEKVPTVYHSTESQILETLRGFHFSHSAIRQTATALGNKDRGTITEYYRGLCFQYFTQYNSYDEAAAALAATDDPKVKERVAGKMRSYVENVRQSVCENPDTPTCYKGLPKKFHSYLDTLVRDIRVKLDRSVSIQPPKVR
ncbi:sigma 54-interacting transcriptional regulator [bacterium]|nr:sigma 54-interacting transcriptional regulator [bacterium]